MSTFRGLSVASVGASLVKTVIPNVLMRFKVLAFVVAFLCAVGLHAAAVESAAEPSSDAPGGEEIIYKYLSATQEQQTALRGVSMQVNISAEVPKLQKQGKLEALRNISKLGKITYKALTFIGDKSIKTEVIARYLTADTESQSGQDISITPANYKFKFKGLQDHDGKESYVFQLSPRKKRVGLFKGELWVDPHSYMPVRESGRFVKSPSIFLKKIEFVRTYDIKEGLAVPQHLESKLETRIFGPVNLHIDFTNFEKNENPDLAAAASAVQ